MSNDMVMRSVYLRPDEDAALRTLAFEIKVTKSDLIRSAISAKLMEWMKSKDNTLVMKDLELGRRHSPAERAEQARAAARAEADAAEKQEAERQAVKAQRNAARQRRQHAARQSDRPSARQAESKEAVMA